MNKAQISKLQAQLEEIREAVNAKPGSIGTLAGALFDLTGIVKAILEELELQSGDDDGLGAEYKNRYGR